jgi:hypothetical protein
MVPRFKVILLHYNAHSLTQQAPFIGIHWDCSHLRGVI